MLLDVLGPGLEAAVALGKVGQEELLDEGLDIAVNVTGEVQLPGEDLLVDSHWIVVDEGRLAGEHLVNKDPEGPPVNSLPVPLVEENLRRNVFGGPAEGVRLEGNALCKPKVSDLEVPGGVEQQVLGLEVSVDEVLQVKELENKNHMGGVEFGGAVVEPSCLS